MIDLSKLQNNALTLSERFREPATDLFSVLAVMALIWTGYHAQFRGLHDFVGALLRIVVTSSLILAYKDMAPTLFESRDNLILAVFPTTSFSGGKIFTTAFTGIGSAVAIMGLSGIPIALGLGIVIVICTLMFWAQHLFEAVLLAFGPLALATLAFRNTTGVFTMWLKSMIAVLLIPVGWTMGLSLLEMVMNNPTADFMATVLMVTAAGAIYIGMPIITLLIVNSAGGAAAVAMPSIAQFASGLMGGMGSRMGLGGRGGGKGADMVTLSTRSVTAGGTNIATSMAVPASSTPAQMSAYEGRIAQIHKIRDNMNAQKTTNTEKP